jgi:excisionase family DNA binding protein
MEKPIDDLKLISVAEAAAALNVSTRTIIRLIAEGSIDAPKIRRRRLISISSLRQFLGLKTD